MKQIETEININAPAGKVWSVLTDYNSHSNWNPFIRSISGDKFEGGCLEVSIQPHGGSLMRFSPKILVFNEPKEFRWRGKFLVRGLMDGEHYFIIDQENAGTTRLVHGELFSGILAGLFGNVLEKTKKGFEMMNIAIKEKCENPRQ